MGESSKAVLITGCSSGIGHATALRLHDSGWNVYASARRPESIADLAEHGCHTLALDVTDESSMAAAVAQVLEHESAVGVLINNAGYSQSGAVESVSIEAVRRQFETNVFGVVRMIQLTAPGMRAQGWGRIVNVGSMGGRLAFPGGGHYHATKYALEGLSDSLRFELRPFGIGVSLIEPGLIVTDFGSAAQGSLAHAEGGGDGADGVYAAFNEAVGKLTSSAYEGPMARLGAGPERVARAIEKAISADRPPARVPVTASARLLMGMRRLLPDRAWDGLMRAQFPAPGADAS